MMKILKWAGVIFGLSAASFAVLLILNGVKRSACLKGEVASNLLNNDIKAAEKIVTSSQIQ